MKRIFTILSVLSLITVMFAICACAADPASTTAPAATTAAPVTPASTTAKITTAAPVTTAAPITDENDGKLVIVTAEKANYKIIYKKGLQTPVIDALENIEKLALEALGTKVLVKADTTDASEKEILVGLTNREGFEEYSSNLNKNEYFIGAVGEKIVITGGSQAALVAAINKFAEAYFSDIKDSVTVPSDLNIKDSIPMDDVVSLKKGWNPLKYKATNGVNIPYQIYLPGGYSPDKEYPCILYMHSAGVVCTDNSHIYQGEAAFLNNLLASKYKHEAIIIAPCCAPGNKWVTVNSWGEVTYDFVNTSMARYMSAALEVLEFYQGELSIDDQRLYTYGMSMGGFAVWDLLARNPGKFAAAIPVAGAGDPNTVSTMGDTAIWIFHGKLDDVVPVTSAYAMKDALYAIGRNDVKYTEFPTLAHGIWGATAATDGLFDWLFSQTLDKQ